MSRSILIKIGVGLFAWVALSASTYVVQETEQVIITQFGEPRGNPVNTPGLHFKLPFIQRVISFEKRFLEWDGSPNQMPTKDKRFIWVDMYARWRITDPLKFLQRMRDERGAQSRLDDILDGETRNAVASYDLIELVRSSNRPAGDIPIESEEDRIVLEQIAMGRRAIATSILTAARARTADLGIEILDIRLKRINYVDEVAKDVYARLIAERRRIAERFRSEGEGEAARIQGERQRDLQRIQSEAYRTAQELRGKADAEATAIYAEAYGRDAEVYAFFKSLETYERVIDGRTYFVLGTDSDLLRYLRAPR
ncbi:MAG: protease modulator HflC [Acidobacteria bacterium]|nr:protease modulator HflC [Acidobacteriota bacterium]